MIKIQNLTIVVILVILGFGFNLNAASFEFVSKDELVSGGLNDEIRAKAEIRNITASVINVKSKLEILSLTPGHSIVFCWDVCYPPKEEDCVSEGYLTLMPLGTSGENFHADVFADGHLGESKVKFTFFNMDNPDDNISFVVTFLVGTTSVEKTISDIKYSLSEPSPNPVSSSSLISYVINNDFNDAKIRFFNTQGFEVFKQQLTESTGNLNLELLNLSQGIYFYHLKIDGYITETKKFVLVR